MSWLDGRIGLMVDQSHIRNFSIIAHIDHGKSTLADRILEITKTVPPRQMRDRFLDKMDLERERGVTIKLQPIRISYQLPPAAYNLQPTTYHLNLIDTPGHVDFSYEVSRSLAACEGAVLLVDLAQGVQAQTLSHLRKARDLELKIVPVINKIDLDIQAGAEEQLIDLGFEKQDILHTSGRTGEGIDELIKAIIERIPAPAGQSTAPLRALIFDSYFDSHKGVILLVKIADGSIARQNGTFPKLQLMASNASFVPLEVGYLKESLKAQDCLGTGEVGYIATGVKDIKKCRVGDTVVKFQPKADPPMAEKVKSEKLKVGKTNQKKEEADVRSQRSMVNGKKSAVRPLPGYKEVRPRAFAGIYPSDTNKINDLRDALEKLVLNDASLSFIPESSLALGRGFRIGCLGQFHLEIAQERLRREYGIEVISTTPTVEYVVKLKACLADSRRVKSMPSIAATTVGAKEGQKLKVKNQPVERSVFTKSPTPKVTGSSNLIRVTSVAELPEWGDIQEIQQPWIEAVIITPSDHLSAVMQVCENSRGEMQHMDNLGGGEKKLLRLVYHLPLNELLTGFFGHLKSATSGFASFDYNILDYRTGDIVRLDFLLNKEIIEPLSLLLPRERALQKAKEGVNRLKELIPSQLFSVPVQAVINNRIAARADIRARGKNVLAKLYGGDRTRKDKLLQQQKKGKERLRQIGKVNIPTDIFKKILAAY
ncbi:GTP-binding protein [Patescibacteria group bacterium]|nr:GTP-binding protein [Patescibacteria group bacterium]